MNQHKDLSKLNVNYQHEKIRNLMEEHAPPPV